ncbi:L-glutamate gamma-semialdehyde dehydrogenase [Acidobacteriota bacterium]
MTNAIFETPEPKNEPILSYAPGTPERARLKDNLEKMRKNEIEIPIVIGGKDVASGDMADCRCPHNHQTLLGKYHKAGSAHVNQAVAAAAKAYPAWSTMPWEERAAIFLKAADLLAGPYRDVLNGATMLGQSKNVYQAEIDSACELIDFWRFNPYFMKEIYTQQPMSAPGMWNRVEHRALEGYIFAVTPFNFTSIAGNLPTAPAMMGNTVVWKPASSAVYSAHYLMEIWKEAGLPDGVINMVPGPGGQVGDPAMDHPDLAGVHFTGSTEVFHRMWRKVGENIANYKTYPRIVGETGGKDFIFAHPSADPLPLSVGLLRAAYEYQGQKCSACSRAYIPGNLWPAVKDMLLDQISTITMGDVEDFTNFMNAVIDKAAFTSIREHIEYARNASDARILCGGGTDDSMGYFIEPTVIKVENPRFKTMCEEIFGPVLTLYVYPENEYAQTLEICNTTSPYALTGAIFARDRQAVVEATARLRHAAGNFYINDKCTAAVVGQQPFGGSRASGTNDKAGSPLNLQRWVSQRTIKETFVPPTDYRYPFMEKE